MLDKHVSLLLRAGLALSALVMLNLLAAPPARVEARGDDNAFGFAERVAWPSPPEFQVLAAKLIAAFKCVWL